MSHIWTFAQSSEGLLKRCIDAAAPEDPGNKWVKHLKRKRLNPIISDSIINAGNVKIYKEDCEPLPDVKEEVKPEILESEIDDTLFENIENDPIYHLDFLIEKCVLNQKLVIELAEKLSGSTVEKICNHLFSKKDANVIFLQYFYELFFPTYLKREYSLFSLDLLIKAENSNPLLFKKLLQILFKNLEIPSKVLQDFFQNLNEQKKIEFTSNLIETDLSNKEFSHHLFTIYIAYKDSKKNDRINNFIFTNLIKNSQNCVSEKNYGRLLLLFLQVMKENPRNDMKKLENVMEIHRTPFKKPCLNIFKEILDRYRN